MTIALLLNKGTGTFFENANKSSTKAPDLVGFVEFVLDKEKSQSLRLEAAIWLKMKDGKKFYSASIGGIPATMFIEEKQSEQAPDYAGSFGFGREMRIAGWKKPGVGDEKPYISVAISERTVGTKSTSGSDEQPAQSSSSPSSESHSSQQAHQPQPQQDQHPSGVAGFNF
ncbi:MULTISPECIES: hypothetical protein [Pseudomonas]|uniref:hypothetical protein n=1 Tax=Pseudomonas TaxID=286 RepID=UPI00387B879F